MSEPITVQNADQPTDIVKAPVQDSAEVMRIKNERALTEFSSPFASTAAYRHFMTVAEIFADSVFVPAHFKGKPGECLIAIDIARRMGEGELMVMQQMFVVKGNPGFKTKFMIARANRMAGFKSTIKWRKEVLGEPLTVKADKGSYLIPNMSVTAYAVDRFGEVIEASVDSTMAIAEGWTENAKYRSMPEHMFRWRSASFLINLYAPEVMMGMETIEELETMPEPAVKNITPETSGVRSLEERIAERLPPAPAINVAPREEQATVEKPAPVKEEFADVRRTEKPAPAAEATLAARPASAKQKKGERVTLAAEDVDWLRGRAEANKVGWTAVEEFFGGPIEDVSEAGKDERALWELVEDAIRTIAARQRAATEKGGGEPASSSLFDDRR